MAVDLHVHTTASSDGDYTPRAIVEMASQKKLQAIAITDHDSVAGLEEGLYWGEKLGLEVIPGCEFYAQHLGKWLHILGYFIDFNSSAIKEFSKKIAVERKRTTQKQMETLRQAGFFLEEEKVYAENPLPMFHTFAKVIFADQRNEKNPLLKKYRQADKAVVRFCMDWLIPGKPLNAPQYTPQAQDVFQLIRRIGGIPVLAHPAATLSTEDDYVIDDLIKCGLAGLEVYTSWHNEADEKHYEQYAGKRKLIMTSGSDFHGSLKPYAKLGEVKNNTYSLVEKLKISVSTTDRHCSCM